MMPHHESEPEHIKPVNISQVLAEQQAKDRMLEEFLGKAPKRFPQGQLSANDEGEIAMAMTTDIVHKKVIIQFAKPIRWLGMGIAEATHLRDMLNEKIKALL